MLVKPPGMSEEEWEVLLLNLRRRRRRHRARLGLGGSGTPGVVSANSGSFIVAGQIANLAVGRVPLAANTGSFAITGNAATLTYSGAGATDYTATYLSHFQY